MKAEFLNNFIQTTIDQAKAFDNFVLQQREVSKAVREKNWLDLQSALLKAGDASDQISVCEEKRLNVWKELLIEAKLPLDSTVFGASITLPPEERNRLNTAYRQLRLSAIQAKIENESISAFVGEAAKTLGKAIESFFPGASPNTYSRKGTKRQVGGSGLFINTAF